MCRKLQFHGSLRFWILSLVFIWLQPSSSLHSLRSRRLHGLEGQYKAYHGIKLKQTTIQSKLYSVSISNIEHPVTNGTVGVFDGTISTSSNQSINPSDSVGSRQSKDRRPVNIPRSLRDMILFTYFAVRRLSSMSWSFFREALFPQSNLNKNQNMRNIAKGKKRKDLLKVFLKPKFLFRCFVLSVVLVVVQRIIEYNRSLTQEVALSYFLKAISTYPEQILSVRVTPSVIYFMVNGKRYLTRVVNIQDGILSKLVKSGVDFAAMPQSTNVFGVVWSAAYLYFIWMMFSRLQGPKDENIGKSREQMALDSYGSLSFDDVAGQDKAKLEVKEICDMLRFPETYTNVGARLPSGVLLCGPPGTGKTLLARVTAAEAQVPFFACSATEFVEVFVGRGPARIRKLFKSAAENAPCIIFIDEIDSIGRSRRLNTLNSEQENTLNQLLTCMDGLDTSNNGVIVIAATNRAELLDPALLRPGRFDRLVQCSLPDKDGRLAILKVHVRRIVMDSTVKLDVIAAMASGLSGADLATLINESAIRAVRRGSQAVSQQDLYDALRTFLSSRGMQLPINPPSISDVAADFWKKMGLGNGDPFDDNRPITVGS